MPVTIRDLALYRGAKPIDANDPESHIPDEEFERVGLAFAGGCASCGRLLFPDTAYPTEGGVWRCVDHVADQGYEDVRQANAAVFDSMPPDTVAERITSEDMERLLVAYADRMGMVNLTEMLERYCRARQQQAKAGNYQANATAWGRAARALLSIDELDLSN